MLLNIGVSIFSGLDVSFAVSQLKLKLTDSSEYLTYSLAYHGNPGRPDLYIMEVTDSNGSYWTMYNIWMWLENSDDKHVAQRIVIDLDVTNGKESKTPSIYLKIERI